MLGENGTEQFTITTRVDDKIVDTRKIHDPFLRNKTTIGISRFELFKCLFKRQFKIVVAVSVDATEGMVRKVMSLDLAEIERETAQMLEDRKRSREASAGNNNCFVSGVSDAG